MVNGVFTKAAKRFVVVLKVVFLFLHAVVSSFVSSGFKSFLIDEQISMVQMCMFPIVAVVLSLTYDVNKRDLRWFNFTSEEMKLIFECFDPFCHLEEAMHMLGQAIHDLCPDEIEVAFLCGIHLIDSGQIDSII